MRHRADWMYERKWGVMVHYLDYFEKPDEEGNIKKSFCIN